MLVIVDGRPELVDVPKKRSSRRSVPLADEAVEALRSHRARQADERLRLGADYMDLDLVFARETGEPEHPVGVTRRFAALAREAGVTPIRLHDTTHAWATLALQASVPAKVVSEILGHANISITLDT